MDSHLCGTIKWNAGQNVYPIDCGGRTGRIVKIVQKTNYLTLAEVQVFGPAKIAECGKNSCEIPKGTIGLIANGKRITSTNGEAYAVMEKNGNFVLYCKGGVPIWASNTNGKSMKDGLKLQVGT